MWKHALPVLAALLAAAPALGATQGTTGATSTGSVGVALTIPNLVRLTQVNDIALGNWTGAGDMQGTDSVCVWSTTRKYRVTATGSGAGGAFTLAAAPSTLAYTVQWRDVAGASSGTAMTAGTPLTGQNTSVTSTTCGGGTNATVLVRVAESALAAAPAANYLGTLTLVVAPE
jgi:hypothetical protein